MANKKIMAVGANMPKKGNEEMSFKYLKLHINELNSKTYNEKIKKSYLLNKLNNKLLTQILRDRNWKRYVESLML